MQSAVLLITKNYLWSRSQQVIINDYLSGDVKVKTGVPQRMVLGPLPVCCYMFPLDDKLKELEKNYHFYADNTVHCFGFGSTLSQCMFDNFLNSSQRWFSNAKLKLNAERSEYMIIWKCKNVQPGFLLVPEDSNYIEQIKFLGCYND